MDAEVIRWWALVLDLEALSGNVTKSSGRGRSGWKYRDHRKECTLAVGKVLKYTDVPQAEMKRRVTVTRLWGKGCRAFDVDNLAWGFKPLFDELKSRGLIVEDSPKWVDRIYRQAKSEDGRPKVLVRIEELE
jgi:Holliday junction resolvase RusA-like endonuclease